MENAIPESLPAELAFLAPVEVDGLMRLGNPHDGGYVVPRSTVQSVDTLLSFGLSSDWTFEEEFKRINASATIHAYDHTVGARKFRRAFERGIPRLLRGRITLRELQARFRTWRTYRQFFASEATHFKERIHAVNAGPGHATIGKVFGRTNSDRVLLKIDIEGAEYGIIGEVLRHAGRIQLLIVEFHETMALRETFCAALQRLLREFHIVHVHGNNHSYIAPDGLPNVLEITFVKGPAPDSARRRQQLPVAGLDGPNQRDRADVPIRFVMVTAASQAERS